MKNKKITFRLTDEDKERLEAEAAALDIPLSQLIRQLCKEYLERR